MTTKAFLMRWTKPARLLTAAAALLTTTLTTTLPAQTIHGTVVDLDGLPVADAQIELAGSARSRWADALGRFAIAPAPSGEQKLRAFSEDFETVEVTVDVPASGTVAVQLQFTAVRLSTASIEVVGESSVTLQEIPGSVYLISKDELEVSHPADANEVLRKVPGVTLREDSGPAAMRLNIGIRGLNPDRSRKVLMLEDGIPIALAPYGEPEMYYSPPIDRMRRVEVLKGSGQIVHGPQTVGGVINFVTPDPPPKTHLDLDIQGGQRGFFSGQASLGGSNSDQSAGWLVNYLRKQGDGWRDFWFDIDDVTSKFTFKPNNVHTFAAKLGFYDERSNSTYLGLTLPMFLRDANQNAVPGDELKVRRYSGSLSHTATVNPNAVWNTTLFAYNTVRNWGRQDWHTADQGADYLGIFGDPGVPGGAIFLLDSAGNRNRQFNVFGIQTGAKAEHDLAGIRGSLDFGVRYVYEDAQDQRIDGQGFRARTGVLRDDENRFGRAFSAHIQDRFRLGDRVIFTPGVRFEHYTQERHILRQRVRQPDGSNVPTNVDIRNQRTITQAVPGLGLSVRANDHITLFSGVHRGFAPPRTKIAITNDGDALDLDAELSWNYEAGARFRANRAVTGEVTFFRLDFENQVITAAESGGATTTLVNGGETLHQGIESSLRINWDEVVNSPWLVYTDLRHMYLATAEFTNNTLYQGNRLPYAPRNTLTFLLGVRQRRGFGFQIDVSRIAEQFGDNDETIAPSNDGTAGLLPSYTLLNATADYSIRRERLELTPYFTVKNFTNQLYISSRAPQGIQPGLFRQANAGIRISF
ncbi:MAG: TonB-dependent receptor [Acidobacteria bacterium]|nr:TonB-dependent receptor [Acidobacteriota bacterium]